MAAHVLVPLKRLDQAKSRLVGILDAHERAKLMTSLLAGVVAAVEAARVGPLTIVTSERLDGMPVWHDRGLGWNEALAAAMREIVTAPVVAIVSADLPLLSPDDVKALVEATPERGIAIARATDGGTNAVSMRPPGLVETHFGESGSAAVHAALGVDAVLLDIPGLAFDVDSPADLERMRREAA